MAYRKRSSSPGGSATLRQVLERIGDGWPAGLTVLTGDDLYHLDAAQRALLEALVPADASEFALTVHGEQRVDVSTVVNGARSVGMFAPQRVVLVRDVGALEGEAEPLLEYAAQPPEASHLIIRAPELDRRRKLHQALSKAGVLLGFAAPDDLARMATEAKAIAKAKGLRLDTQAAGFLAEICAGDLYRVDSELEKLRSWLGDGAANSEIGLEAVHETAAGSGLLSGWEVADALLQRDEAAALAALRRLVESGQEPLRLLGGLAFRARAMLQAKALVRAGMAPDRARRSARLWGDSPRRIDAGLARYRMEDVLRFPSLLLGADRDLKSRSLAPGAVLERLVEELTGPAGESR